MAITRITYTVTRTFFQEGILPKKASVLEFGEANCDIPTETLAEDIRTLVEDPAQRDRLQARKTAQYGKYRAQPRRRTGNRKQDIVGKP